MEAEDAPSYRLTNTVTFCIVKIAGQKLKAIVDTGATQCVLAWRIASQLGLLREIERSRARFRLASGEMTTPEGYIPALRVECGGLCLPVSTHVVRTTSYDFLLGVNWLDRAGAEIRFNTK